MLINIYKMRTRGNLTAKKRLGRKQTKKYGLRKLMFGGVLTKEEALQAKIEEYKKKLREILEKITELKKLKETHTSDEDKGKIDDAIKQLMEAARTQKKKIEEKTNELKRKEEEAIAELQAKVDKEFEVNPYGFSAARATQSVVGSIAQAKNAMSQNEKFLSEMEPAAENTKKIREAYTRINQIKTEITKIRPRIRVTQSEKEKTELSEEKEKLELRKKEFEKVVDKISKRLHSQSQSGGTRKKQQKIKNHHKHRHTVKYLI